MDQLESAFSGNFEQYEEIEQNIPFACLGKDDLAHEGPDLASLQLAMNRLRFLSAMQKYEKRGMDLTGFIILRVPDHLPAWRYRKEYLYKKKIMAIYDEELIFCNEAIKNNIHSQQAWKHREFCLDNTEGASYATQIAFIDEILDQDVSNWLVWNHCLWLARKFKYLERELIRSEDFIKRHTGVTAVWFYRKNLLLSLSQSLITEEELVFAILKADINIEAVWIYLHDIYESLKHFSTRLKAFCLDLYKAQRENRYSLVALLFNELRRPMDQIDHKLAKDIVIRLKDKIDTAKKLYWQQFEVRCLPSYLEQNQPPSYNK